MNIINVTTGLKRNVIAVGIMMLMVVGFSIPLATAGSNPRCRAVIDSMKTRLSNLHDDKDEAELAGLDAL